MAKGSEGDYLIVGGDNSSNGRALVFHHQLQHQMVQNIQSELNQVMVKLLLKQVQQKHYY
ncbi:MAG: hypothetical protein CM15mV88_090 [Caudoviricetes sp.]|nr:MAG: hypothetical protein CM15mV88_090 [Caudoviricetes sp.]